VICYLPLPTIQTAYLHFQDELTDFGEKVLPLVRQYEAEAVASGEALRWPTYDNYPLPAEIEEETPVAKRVLEESDHQAEASKKVKVTA
jgi:hypothetical protein